VFARCETHHRLKEFHDPRMNRTTAEEIAQPPEKIARPPNESRNPRRNRTTPEKNRTTAEEIAQPPEKIAYPPKTHGRTQFAPTLKKNTGDSKIYGRPRAVVPT